MSRQANIDDATMRIEVRGRGDPARSRGSQPARGPRARAEILATPTQIAHRVFRVRGLRLKKRRVSATIEAPFMDARLS
jgi:hypothetical protein